MIISEIIMSAHVPGATTAKKFVRFACGTAWHSGSEPAPISRGPPDGPSQQQGLFVSSALLQHTAASRYCSQQATNARIVGT